MKGFSGSNITIKILWLIPSLTRFAFVISNLYSMVPWFEIPLALKDSRIYKKPRFSFMLMSFDILFNYFFTLPICNKPGIHGIFEFKRLFTSPLSKMYFLSTSQFPLQNLLANSNMGAFGLFWPPVVIF